MAQVARMMAGHPRRRAEMSQMWRSLTLLLPAERGVSSPGCNPDELADGPKAAQVASRGKALGPRANQRCIDCSICACNPSVTSLR